MAEITIRRWNATAQCYREDLGKGISLDMILVSGGEFLMGSPEGEPERSKSEGPQHRVQVSSFLLGRYAVTYAQWNVVASMPRQRRAISTRQPLVSIKDTFEILEVETQKRSEVSGLSRVPYPSTSEGQSSLQAKLEDQPVTNVNWYEAQEFCERLTNRVNRFYRLPTEAEWEYACRAGTTTPFYFGSTLTDQLATYRAEELYGSGPAGAAPAGPAAVTSRGIANRWGLCDMHGNVDEWCYDSWHDTYEGAPSNGSAWTEKDAANRVLRGGAWSYGPADCRSAARAYLDAGVQNPNVGLRVACSLPPGVV